jgi:precorrin-6B methylase 2
LASGCKGKVYAIDHFRGSKGERETYHRDHENAEAEWTKNVGCRFSNVVLYKEDSLKAAEHLHPAQMIFIDGGHSYAEVMADLKAWNPLATRLICGHDYTNMGEVQKAVNEFFGQGRVRVSDSIWWVEKGEWS